jgi:cadmium resistance protein CadD (predicted permease)
MIDALTIISVAAGAYIATNLDNLTLLVTLQARFRTRLWAVSTGFMTSNLLLGALGFWIGTAANNVPVEYLGFLGFIPMSLGVIGVIRMFRGRSGTGTVKNGVMDTARAVFIATLITQLSNGTDTVLTFAALFADSTAATDLLIVFTLAGMATIFLLIASYGVRHPALSQWIERNAPRLTPWILIFVGAYIVANTATDMLPD